MHVNNLLNIALWVFSGVVILAGVVLAFVLGKSFAELRNTIKTTFDTETKQLIENEVTELRQTLRTLREEVASTQQYRAARVVWISQPREVSTLDLEEQEKAQKRIANEQNVIETLAALGVSRIEQMTPMPGTNVTIGATALVIFTFEQSPESRMILASTVAALKNIAQPPVLLLYTYDPNGTQVVLADEDRKILLGYDWYVPVNFSPQLITQVLTLLRRAVTISGASNGNL